MEQKASISPEEYWQLRKREVKARRFKFFSTLILGAVQSNPGVFTPKVLIVRGAEHVSETQMCSKQALLGQSWEKWKQSDSY